VDVPGHERFVKNMIAGVGAIDFVLFVVAADDGWMPQSAEHLAILRYLGVSHGIIVVTKSDLVDPDWLVLVGDDIRQHLAGSFLADSPLVTVDSLSGRGIPELKAAIGNLIGILPRRHDIGKPRLYIDRAFTISGRGAVVTGTLTEGQLTTGQTLMVVPGEMKVRVRELQTHGRAVPVAPPGQRVAINLAGIETADLKRGHCLVLDSDSETVDRLWADVHVLADSTHPLEHGRRVLVMVGTAEPEGAAYPLEQTEIPPGHHGMCELRLDQPVKARLRDRFVLRWPTPGVTIGGGVILDVGGTRQTRKDPGLVARLRTRSTGTIASYRTTELQKHGYAARARFLEHGPFTDEEIESDLTIAIGAREACSSGDWILHTPWLEDSRSRLLDALSVWHQANSHSPGLNLAEWQEHAGIPGEPMAEIAALLLRDGSVSRTGEAYHLPNHTPKLPVAWNIEAEKLWKTIDAGGHQPPTRPELELTGENARAILAFWVAAGQLVQLGDGVIFPKQTFDRIRETIVAHLKNTKEMSAAQLRDLLGTSRRYAVPILEALDREGTTRREGDVRVLAEPK
ncbi:MAG: SelB C-terminal domain-containing protein, partial [candidate division Zixibacteria bacterium]|nr:SelB C-terminal domain-containing protein [candidate division Zixibacteria bacterium]